MKIQDTSSALRTVSAPIERDLPTPNKQTGVPDISVDGDRADLTSSRLARSVALDSAAQSSASSLTPERLQSIRERIAANYYDRPAVLDQTSNSVAAYYSPSK